MHDNTIYLPKHPVWGQALAVLGGDPVWPVAGAADDDDDAGDGIDLDNPNPAGGRKASDILDDEPDEDEPGDAAGDDESSAKAKPSDQPVVRTEADFKRLEDALTAERTLRKKREGMIAEFRKKERDTAADGDDAAAEQVRKAGEDAAAKYKPVAIRAAAKSALLEANFQRPTDERIKKIIKRLDLEDIDVDDDGDVIGLQEQIEQLMEDFPELFTAPVAETTVEPVKRRAPRMDASDRKPGAVEPKSTGERLAARIIGGQ